MGGLGLNPQIFREYDIRGLADTDLSDPIVEAIGKGFGSLLREKNAKEIALGRDGRLSSPRIAQALSRGLLATGIGVTDLGIVTTPMLYFGIVHLKKGGGVMVTGSHNPLEFNGLKPCVGKENLYGEGIQALRRRTEEGRFVSGQGKLDRFDLFPVYREFIRQEIQLKKPLRVAIDAGNGTSGLFAPQLFRDLGCEVKELYCNLDGSFPNHFPDPTVMENLLDLRQAVVSEKADLGIAFDGDADRVGIVDEQGQVIEGDRLLILLARDVLKKNRGATIIGEVKCSKLLFDDIEKHGGRAVMWKAGHSLIKAKMRETGAILAGEMSGHLFFADRYFGFDDGMYGACRIAEILASSDRPMSRLLSDLPRVYSTPEIRIECDDEKKFEIVKQATQFFREGFGEVIELDGVRVNFQDGWGLIRASNTQPVLVMRFEAESERRLEEIRTLMEGKVKELMRHSSRVRS